ncbi:MBL fold metallo-hydrolase [Panacibacter sp. DH6]|uniref:MBL fold metallo-hydrolase n=1 Tax=Panacibacter microcysteis TaxID=2793269 RepID=A0A931GY14_9BACT|nr:MBL fold metallo-hydrolase [Panacibacter microcysteis]MBG9377114.1 MBL fold metallo-hydrolase [Panacibacter microcysteis]
MSLFIASLNSGSNGNCYYVGNNQEAVLIDAGISCRETERRMEALGLQMQHVKAIFISHEHVDHISGLKTICNRHRLPVYITNGTLQYSKLGFSNSTFIPFSAADRVSVGGLSIHAFKKCHDANDPHSFIVECNGIRIGVFTDIGIACDNVVHHFKQCHAAFLEANYDEAMLASGRYPYYLKRRITGGNGHLSNRQAFELFVNHRPSYMTHLILSHLSKNNNDPALVEALFRPYAQQLNIVVASRFEASSLYEVSHVPSSYTTAPVRKVTGSVQQLAMF